MERLRSEGLPVPLLDTRPELLPGLSEVWRAICELSATRSVGFAGPNPITASEVLAWCELNEIDDRARLWRLVAGAMATT